MAPGVKASNFCAQLGVWARHGHRWRDRVDGQWRDRPGRELPLTVPFGELLAAGRIDDSAETDPGVSGCAHRAVLAGRVHRRLGPLLDGQMGGRPPGNLELRMPRVVAASDPVPVSESLLPVPIDQHGAEWFIPGVEGFACQLNASAQMLTIHGSEG